MISAGETLQDVPLRLDVQSIQNPSRATILFIMLLFHFHAALCGVFGSLCLNRGLQLEKAAPAALMRNVDILLAFLFDYVVFGHAPRILTLLGGLLVVLSTGGVALGKWWRSRDNL